MHEKRKGVARVRRRSNRPPSSVCKSIWQIWKDKKFLSFISGKIKWESPPSILVARNPNQSQRSGTKTGCIKRRYQHPNYALPKVSCIILLLIKSKVLFVVSNCRSVYGLRKVLICNEILILSGKNLIVLCRQKKYLFNIRNTFYV